MRPRAHTHTHTPIRHTCRPMQTHKPLTMSPGTVCCFLSHGEYQTVCITASVCVRVRVCVVRSLDGANNGRPYGLMRGSLAHIWVVRVQRWFSRTAANTFIVALGVAYTLIISRNIGEMFTQAQTCSGSTETHLFEHKSCWLLRSQLNCLYVDFSIIFIHLIQDSKTLFVTFSRWMCSVK